MVATTDQKARLHDLTVSVLEMIRDGTRSIEDVSKVLQIIKENPGFALRLFGESDLLKFVGSVSVDGAERSVVVHEHLKTDDNFKRIFYDKVEGVPQIELNIHELRKPSPDEPIIKELGGEERVEIQIVSFLNFLSGRRGGWFVAYCRGVDKKVWAVFARWNDACGCWDVETRSFWSPIGWDAGTQVLSRK